MPRVTERLRNLECHSVRECVPLHQWEKCFGVSGACTAFPLKGNVIQSAEREGLLEGRRFMLNMKEVHNLKMFIYTSDLMFGSMTKWLISLDNLWHFLLGVHEHLCGCGSVHAPTWLSCRTWVNTSCHPETHSGGRTVWRFPQSLQKKRACHWQEECARPPRQAPPHRLQLPPNPQTSIHWTHQVISWGLKYLLGKYLPWLSDPTS